MYIKNITHTFNAFRKHKLQSKDESKETDIKNCACYYFGDIIKDGDTYLVHILLEEKLFENISVCDILYKTSKISKPLQIRFNKIDKFIRVYGYNFFSII